MYENNTRTFSFLWSVHKFSINSKYELSQKSACWKARCVICTDSWIDKSKLIDALAICFEKRS
jgi:hypothetical protein